MTLLKSNSVFDNELVFPAVPVDSASIEPIEPNESFFGFSSNNNLNVTFG